MEDTGKGARVNGDFRRSPIQRWEKNPILKVDNFPHWCTSICNAGAVKLGGEYLLLVTAQSLEGLYAIFPARSADGFHFTTEERPILAPSSDPSLRPYESQGVQDARVTYLEGYYYIGYDAMSEHGYRLGLARTRDFVEIERLGLISEPDTKGCALFPERIQGRYARLERPWEGRSIWVSYSDDLEHWGWSEVVMTPRSGFWDTSRIGVASPPMAIEQGWLFFYYGVKDTSAGPLFRLGAAILDRKNPARVVARTNVPVVTPTEIYERIGDVPNLVFSCGAILESDGALKLYWGAANACICVGTCHVADVVRCCFDSGRGFS